MPISTNNNNPLSTTLAVAMNDDDHDELSSNDNKQIPHQITAPEQEEDNIILDLQDIFGMEEEDETGSQQNNNNNEPFTHRQQQPQHSSAATYLLNLQVFNSHNEASRLSNKMSRANLEISQLKDEISNLKAEKKAVETENDTLKHKMNDAAGYVRAECEKQIEAEKARVHSANFDAEELCHQLELKKEADKLFDRQFLFKIGKMIDDEIKRQKMEDPSFNTSSSSATLPPTPQKISVGTNTTEIIDEGKESPSSCCLVAISNKNHDYNNNDDGFFARLFSRIGAAATSVFTTTNAVHQTELNSNSFFASASCSSALSSPIPIEEKKGPLSAFDKTLLSQVRSLRQIAHEQASSLTHSFLLEKLFHLASEEMRDQLNKVNKMYRENACVLYNGFNHENFVRNPCLFSGCSKVLERFMKKCPAHHFSKLVDTKTGLLNSEYFTFAFHGVRGGVGPTKNIQCEGFDPSKRGCKSPGYGEYCAWGETALTTAIGYGSQAGTILVLLVYRPPAEEIDDIRHKKALANNPHTVNGKIFGPVAQMPGYFVIENPLDRSEGTYELPLGCVYQPGTIHCTEIAKVPAFFYDPRTRAQKDAFKDLNGAQINEAWKLALSRSCECAGHQKKIALETDNEEEESNNNNNNNNTIKKRIFYTPHVVVTNNNDDNGKKELPTSVSKRLNSILFPELLVGGAISEETSNSRIEHVLVEGRPMAVDLHLKKMVQVETGELFDLIW